MHQERDLRTLSEETIPLAPTGYGRGSLLPQTDRIVMDSAKCDPQDKCLECAIADGMKPLVSVAKCLQHGGSDTQAAIPELMNCAFETLRSAKELANDKQNIASSQNQSLLVQREKLGNEKKQKEINLLLFNLDLTYIGQMKQVAQGMRDTAKRHLHELEGELKRVKKEEKWQKIIRNIVMVILPLYTLIVSVQAVREALHITDETQSSISLSVVVAICQASLYVTYKTVKELENAIEHYTNKVFEYNQKVYTYEKEEGEIRMKMEECSKTKDQEPKLSAYQTAKLDMYTSFLQVVVKLLACYRKNASKYWFILRKVYCHLLRLVGEEDQEDMLENEHLAQKLESTVIKFEENHRASIKGKHC
ncbi:uncharacterized protein LOC102372032 [Alligator sinensis]|uniref:Uncharacterized protein LOC102372032 n=1 Tax=Alligator sinensis TaxID=38654 RepID=A0A1U7SY79_ALLSI|nr:uncharacterized protein LOC102372032 [Alligator sinensis]